MDISKFIRWMTGEYQANQEEAEKFALLLSYALESGPVEGRIGEPDAGPHGEWGIRSFPPNVSDIVKSLASITRGTVVDPVDREKINTPEGQETVEDKLIELLGNI